jgi:anti-sigma regulatory factor (Ser/Thr protein kinase)
MQVLGVASAQAGEATADVNLVELGRIRRMVASEAMASGLSRSRANEFALAANEVAYNAIVHGRPPATLSVWEEDGELICEVTDAGDGIEDVTAGQLMPSPGSPGGRGLWLTRQVCDAVEIHNGTGCTVSLRAAVPN